MRVCKPMPNAPAIGWRVPKRWNVAHGDFGFQIQTIFVSFFREQIPQPVKDTTMTYKIVIPACLLASSALADQTPLPMEYELFETAVPHVDLVECPVALQNPGTFCRATVHHDEIHVFAFGEDGDQPLVGFKSYPFEKTASVLD